MTCHRSRIAEQLAGLACSCYGLGPTAFQHRLASLWPCVYCVVQGFGEVLAGLVGTFGLLLAILSIRDWHLYCVCCWQHCQRLTKGHASLISLGVLSGW
jgi:hypothetical protein